METIAILTKEEQETVKFLESMIQSCFAYEDYKKGGYNYKRYIEPYIKKLGVKLFDFVYNNKVYDLEENYKVLKNTSIDCEGLNYNSLERKQ